MRRAKWPAIALAALAIGAAACSDALGPSASVDHGAMFDDLWHEFDLHYSFFELKNINWDSLGAAYRPQAVAAKDDHAFALALAGMMDGLHDVHVELSPTGFGTMRYLSHFDTISTNFSGAMTLERYVPVALTTPGGHLRYGMLDASVGYIRIPSFEGTGWASEIDQAIAALPAATSLVIDLRDNGGGTYSLAIDMAGRFADKARTYGYVRHRNGAKHSNFSDDAAETVAPTGTRYKGRVFVLANRHSFSSAEDFVLALRAIPGVTIVGDTTGGASGGPIERELANGWTYQLSEWIEYTPEHATFEGIGLAPNIVASGKAGDIAHRIDAALDTVLAITGRR